MKKIPTLFERDWQGDRSRVIAVVNPESWWVIAGEGVATRKFDGTAVLVRAGVMYKRYELKPGRKAPEGFEGAQDPDPETHETPGWVPVGSGPEDRYYHEAWDLDNQLKDGTYELVGPKVQGNPEHFTAHHLIPHGGVLIPDAPRDFDGLREWFVGRDIEGIVWHHPDGRMVKIKKRDFGLKRQE